MMLLACLLACIHSCDVSKGCAFFSTPHLHTILWALGMYANYVTKIRFIYAF
jgi:hypothetical protein